MRLSDAKSLAESLLKKHELSSPWTFQFDSSRRRFGQCRYRNHEIGLSRNLTLLNDEKQVKDTILHEIAHALTPGHHHDLTWKLKAIEIGARPVRCYEAKDVKSASKYLATCSTCNFEYRINRKESTGRYVCRFDKTPLFIRENDELKELHAIELMMSKHNLTEEQARSVLTA